MSSLGIASEEARPTTAKPTMNIKTIEDTNKQRENHRSQTKTPEHPWSNQSITRQNTNGKSITNPKKINTTKTQQNKELKRQNGKNDEKKIKRRNEKQEKPILISVIFLHGTFIFEGPEI